MGRYACEGQGRGAVVRRSRPPPGELARVPAGRSGGLLRFGCAFGLGGRFRPPLGGRCRLEAGAPSVVVRRARASGAGRKPPLPLRSPWGSPPSTWEPLRRTTSCPPPPSTFPPDRASPELPQSHSLRSWTTRSQRGKRSSRCASSQREASGRNSTRIWRSGSPPWGYLRVRAFGCWRRPLSRSKLPGVPRDGH